MGEIDENPDPTVPDEQVAGPAEPIEAEVSFAEAPAEPTAVTTAETMAETVADEPGEVTVEGEDTTEVDAAAPAGDSGIEDSTPTSADEAELDEISAALSDAEAKVDAPDSLDDIAPATTQAVAVDTGAVTVATRPASVPWWPFLAYLAAWIVLTGLAVWQLLQLPPNEAAYESQAYALTVLGGLIMTAVGPLLILAVWFAVWSGRPSNERSGLLTSSLLKGAIATLFGAVLWWAALIIVDYLRLGSPL